VSRIFRIAVLTALAFALAGCGAKKEAPSTLPAGADFAPASSVVYVTGVTDPSSSQWEKADELLGRFPGREELLASARKDLRKEGMSWENDVKPALGDELDLVLLGYKDADHNYVFFTKPKDEAKFAKLLESGDEPQVHRKIDGWTVFADNKQALDNFESAEAAGKPLADDEDFRDAMKAVPADSALRGYVAGKPLAELIEKEVASDPDARSFQTFTKGFGELKSISFSAAAEDDGVALQAAYEQTEQLEVGNFSPQLDDTVPAGALVYLSFGNLEDYFSQVLEAVGKESPEFEKQLDQVQKALGFRLKDDVLPLFSKEGAIAVYRGNGFVPDVLFTLRVPDEDKANDLIERLAAIASLGEIEVRPFTVHGAEGKAFAYPEQGLTIYAVVSDGMLLVSNSRSRVDEALGDGSKLSDDTVYQAARDAASQPDETAGFVYANLKVGLPLVFGAAEGDSPGSLPPEVRANTKPLESAILYTKQDGERTTISGFLTIK
jgi:hypothetical protein